MIGLGIGSLPLLAVLTRVEQMPSWLGRSGFVGYLALICGIAADGFGAVDFGLLLMIPGALFEVTFAFWLIIYGFDCRIAHDLSILEYAWSGVSIRRLFPCFSGNSVTKTERVV